jgi:hypothetical protein
MRTDSQREKLMAKQRRRWSAWPLAILGAVCIGSCLAPPVAADSFVKSIEEDHGTYYRLKVKLAYMGEKQDFDVVVGCNVKRIYYKDNDSTYEAGLVPTVFGRRMSDGKGLVVRPPDACDGKTTANGKVRPDLLPVIVVYDDADTLSFGTAYLSDDAYENPLAVLKFGGATIEKSTRAEFDEFRRTQPNLVRRESYFSPLDCDAALKKKDFQRLTRPFGHLCQGYMRFRVPDELQALVRQRWPEGRPAYWRPDTYEAENEITSRLWGRKEILSDRPGDPSRQWRAFMEMEPEYTANRGLARRTAGPNRLFPPSVYPTTNDDQAHRWPADPAKWASFLAGKNVFVNSDLDFRGGQTRGFAYCGAVSRVARDEKLHLDIEQKPKVLRVDGHDVVSKQYPFPTGAWIFERDEYVFYYFQIALDSTRGDL